MASDHTNSTGPPPEVDQRSADEDARGPEALAELLGNLAEALDYVGYLLAAKAGQLKLRARRLLILAVLGALAALVGLVVVIVSVWLALAGLAGAIGQLCGGRPWLGELIVGGTILLSGAAGIWFGLRRMRKSGLASAKQRFAARQARQAERFGRTVHETASADN